MAFCHPSQQNKQTRGPTTAQPTSASGSDWLPGLGSSRPVSRNMNIDPVLAPGQKGAARQRHVVDRTLPGGGGYLFVPNVWDSSINKDTPLPSSSKGKEKVAK